MVQVDAFTAEPFAGNPAAVCIMTSPRDDVWMQNVAREMNLSETAFLYPEQNGYHLRWFTPAVEVALCGHATLASAHVLFRDSHVPSDKPISFYTEKSGLLTARCADDWIELDFPARIAEPASPPEGLIQAIGLTPTFVGKSQYDYLIEVPSDSDLRRASPDMTMLKKLPVRGLILTARSNTPQFDFVSRFFAPSAGVNEDPVTGSAHCTLGPYWKTRLNKDRFTAYQASARGGIVRVQVQNDRVLLGGQAVIVMRAELV